MVAWSGMGDCASFMSVGSQVFRERYTTYPLLSRCVVTHLCGARGRGRGRRVRSWASGRSVWMDMIWGDVRLSQVSWYRPLLRAIVGLVCGRKCNAAFPCIAYHILCCIVKRRVKKQSLPFYPRPKPFMRQ